MSLKILQWNCRSLGNKLDLAEKCSEYDIVVLIETWLKPHQSFKLNKFTVFRFDRLGDKQHGGIAILVSEKLVSSQVKLNFNPVSLEYGAVEIGMENGELIIAACYRTPVDNNNITSQEIESLSASLKNFDQFLLLGDFNAHHGAWGSQYSCRNGRTLMENLDLDQFFLLNLNEPTHFYIHNSQLKYSNIDLSFCSMSLAMISDWRVGDDSWNSDHFPVEIFINCTSTEIKKKFSRYNFNKVKWPKFIESLLLSQNDISNLTFVNQNPIHRYQVFFELIKKKLDENLNIRNSTTSNKNHITNDKIKSKRKNNCWWNEECVRLVRIRTARFKSLKYRCDLDSFIEYKKLAAQTTRRLKEIKKESFRSFCQSINRLTPISAVWKKVKIFKNGLNRDQSSPGNKKFFEEAERLFKELCTPTLLQTSEFILNNYDFQCNESNEFLLSPISFEEMHFVIYSVKKNSAPGFDKISYELIKRLPESYLRVLMDIYNDCIFSGTLPLDWNKYLVSFIPKSSDRSKPRPIAMSSCFLKILEKIINNRLMYYVERNKLLSVTQLGFRKGKSSVDNLSIFVNFVQEAFFKGETVAAIFLDIKGAYNCVIPDLLLKDLASLNIPKEYMMFFKNLLIERILIPTNLNKEELEEVLVKLGLPQGSCLSPLLWAIYTRFIETCVDENVKILQFADDIVIFSKARFVNEMVLNLEREVNHLFRCLKAKNLLLAPEKCEFIVFSKEKIHTHQFSIKINGKELKPGNTVRFLGLYLDKQLNWSYQVKQIKERCLKALNIIKCLRGVHWGSDPVTLLMLYKSLIRSKMEYAGFLIAPCHSKLIESLQKVQNRALRLSLGCINSTPINVLHAEAKIPYLEFRFEYLGFRYILRNLSIRNSLVINSIERLSNTAETPVYEHKFEKSLLIKCFEQCWHHEGGIIQSEIFYKFTIPFFKQFIGLDCDIQSGKKILESDCPKLTFVEKFGSLGVDRHIDLYTDGSKIEKEGQLLETAVGCAVFSEKEFFSCSFRLPDLSSIFSAEAMAIIFALNKIEEYSQNILVQVDSFRIFSDSESTLKAVCSIQGLNYESPLICEIRCKILDLKEKGIEVELFWIPSHVGIQGNEQADKMAKVATEKISVINRDIPVSDLFRKFKSLCCGKNQSRLISEFEHKGIFYYERYFNTRNKPWFHDIYAHRRVISTINRIRSGHNSSKLNLFRYNIVDSPMCKCNLYEESIEHIFWQCDRYEVERGELMRRLRRLQLYGPFSIFPLVADINEEVVKILSDFILNCDFNI